MKLPGQTGENSETRKNLAILESTHPAIRKAAEATRQNIERVISINEQGRRIMIYDTDYQQNLHPDSNLPFLISPSPFELPQVVRDNLEQYGQSISAFYNACDVLFRSFPQNNKWRKILTHNRPEWMLEKARQEGKSTSHLFLRPDFILTEDGVVTTEIETSPFGLALSLFLNGTYPEASLPTSKLIQSFIAEVMSNDKDKTLCFLITEHTKKYKGQFEYLGKLLQRENINAIVCMPNDIKCEKDECFVTGQKIDVLYRGFYLHEVVKHNRLTKILQSDIKVVPGYKSHLEENAMMAMFFDPNLEEFFRENLGEHVDVLKEIFPQTYVLEGIPPNDLEIKEWQDLAKFSRKNRKFILKISGFSNLGSWAKGVTFLNRLSQAQCRRVIQEAIESDTIFVIQEFKRGAKFEQSYYNFYDSTLEIMNGRVRFTPYYHASNGDLLTAKTTMCKNTDFIHASTNSINTPIK